MSVITISRGSFSRGKEVAEKVARVLEYECVSREILLEASDQFNIPEIKLTRAIHDAPSILDRFTHGKEQYIAYIRAALLKHTCKDNVVYHGYAGHFFLQGIPHVLKVRVIADLDDRIRAEMQREGISEKEARHTIKKDDDERRKWSLHLYGMDPWDANLYDLVVHIKTKSVDDVVSLILHAANLGCFATTPDSQKIMDNLALAAEVKAALVHDFPSAKTKAEDGVILITVEASLLQKDEITKKATSIVEPIAGVKEVRVDITPLLSGI